MSFFEDTLQNVSDNQGILLRNFNDIGSALLRGPGKRSAGYIYLAAPFTEMAPAGNDLPPESNEENLLSGIKSDADYGILPKEYQKLLKRIEKVLAAQCQMDVHLPHRDINNWGKTKHSSKELTPAILHAVSGAAALVAIPGNSIGVHLELGVAIAQKKPIIIFDVDELPSSFFVAGFSDLPFVKYIPVKTLSQIPKRIKASDLSGFIARMR